MHVLAADCRFQLHKQQSGFIYFFYHFLINLNMRKHFIYTFQCSPWKRIFSSLFSFFSRRKVVLEAVKIFKLLNLFTFSFGRCCLYNFFLFFNIQNSISFPSLETVCAKNYLSRFSRFTLSRALKLLKCRGALIVQLIHQSKLI